MRTILAAVTLLLGTSALAEDVMLQDFDELSAQELGQQCEIVGDNLQVRLVKTDERAGKQNLLLVADVDPANPNWNHIRLRFRRLVSNPEGLTFWYRGDRVARLYLIVEDSKGTRTDTTIGGDAVAGQWHQAIIPLANMHVPNAQPPNDQATPADVAAIELFPYPASYPAKGVYQFQIDDISVTRRPLEAPERPIDALASALQNGDFEALTADGAGFADWSFGISRQAKVSVAVSRDEKHGGQTAALFHDESPLAPHVYGRFLQRVPVQPRTAYRLSCWVKGKGVGGGSHWTDWRSYSLSIPAGDYDWRRVETHFVTAPDQSVLEVGLNIVNVTDQLWVDDVELETDFALGDTTVPGAKIALWCPLHVLGEREDVQARTMWQGMPEGGGTLRMELVQGENPVASAEQPWQGTSGVVDLYLRPQPTAERQHRLVASFLDADGALLGAVARDIDILTAEVARQRLAQARTRLGELEDEMARWRELGLPLDYPTVTKTVAENFIPWIEEDLEHGEVQRALQELDELDGILEAAIAQCTAPPPLAALTVPRYQTGRIEIAGGHFVADVKWPDGRVERRPVFFNGYGHFGAVRRDVEKFPGYGLNILQVEFGPNSTVQPGMVIDLAACREFEALLQRAEQAHVAVNLLLSPHYFPQWAREQWPELNGVSGGFNSFDIDNPHAREVEEAFLRAVIARLKHRPGLHSLCLSNEPIYIDARSSRYNREKWHAWLKERHGTIEHLNAAHGTHYVAFAEVPVENGEDLTPRPALYDWVSFNNQRFADWHRWMADIIHEIDPGIPVHAKIMNLPFARHTVGWGNDVELFCDLSQIAGNDNFNAYIHDDGAEWANGWHGANQYMDLLRSMRGQPSFNSENHIVADRNWQPVPGMHMRNLIWQAAIHGQGASTVWVWERTYDPRSDFAGSIMHRPALCDAHGRTALDLMRLAPEVVAIQDAPARVAIVYSICSQVWNPNYSGDVHAVYQALTFLGEKVDFITYRQLARGEGEKYRVIIVPGVTHFEDAGYEALVRFSQGPGHRLITIGEACLARDEYNRPRDVSALRSTSMAMHDPRDAWSRLPQATGLEFPVRVLDAQTGRPAWGVGWRWARDGNRWLVNLCNYTRKTVRVRVEAEGAVRATNLFTGMAVEGAVELGMMEPMLLQMR